MLNIGITGAAGFLGWHLRAHVHAERDIKTIHADRQTFMDGAALAEFARRSDVVVHLAGMNRGPEAEIEQANVKLTQMLIDACEGTARRPHVIFTNSTHQDRDTAYARSKRRCVELLVNWAEKRGARFTNVIIPGVFGEHGRPFYNSVVATFCHQLANAGETRVIEDHDIELVHSQDVAAQIVKLARDGIAGEKRIQGRLYRVSVLLAHLKRLADQYRRHVIPSVEDPFDLALFNTYRSYLFPSHYPVTLEMRSDERGRLFEAVKTMHGGQCFLSTTRAGVTRGNHYHRSKIERFLVVRGEARIRVRRLLVGDIVEFRVDGDAPVYVDMPTFHTHDITNVGSGELLTLFWAHEIFDASHPDTFGEPVLA